MNQHEILNGLYSLVKEKYDICKNDIAAIGKDHPTEKGALQLKLGIYNVSIAAGLINCLDNVPEVMNRRFKNFLDHLPAEISEHYNGLPDEQKIIMSTALYPETFMRLNFYNTYNTDLEQAEESGDPQKIFKARLKKEVLDEILNMWRDFRVQNDLFVFAFDDKEGK